MADNYPTTRAGWAAWHLQWGIDHNDPPETIQRLQRLADQYREEPTCHGSKSMTSSTATQK